MMHFKVFLKDDKEHFAYCNEKNLAWKITSWFEFSPKVTLCIKALFQDWMEGLSFEEIKSRSIS